MLTTLPLRAEELLQEPGYAEEVRRELSYRPTASKFDYSNRIAGAW